MLHRHWQLRFFSQSGLVPREGVGGHFSSSLCLIHFASEPLREMTWETYHREQNKALLHHCSPHPPPLTTLSWRVGGEGGRVIHHRLTPDTLPLCPKSFTHSLLPTHYLGSFYEDYVELTTPYSLSRESYVEEYIELTTPYSLSRGVSMMTI